MEMDTLLYLAIMIAVGMLFGRLAKFVRLPNVTGYLVGGLIIGPSLFNIIPAEPLVGMEILSSIALGFIAFSIGNEFKFSYFKRVGAMPIVVAVAESVAAVLFVFGGLLLAGQSVPYSLLLGAIAAATAPAATVMVINQYRAKGEVTDTLLSVVAIDDATTLVMFGISVAIAQGILNPSAGNLWDSLKTPLWEIFGSLLVGAALGFLMKLPLRWFKKDGNRLALAAAFVFAGVGLAKQFGFSDLLLCMTMGAVLVNLSKDSGHIMQLTDSVTPPIYLLFFVMSGASLQISVIPTIGIVGVVYLVMRVAGKVFGTWLGGAMSHASANIKKYLGWALVPQAGVAIGLSLAVSSAFPQYGESVRAIVLCATLVYELIGPSLTKICLGKAGELGVTEKPKKLKPTT